MIREAPGAITGVITEVITGVINPGPGAEKERITKGAERIRTIPREEQKESEN